MVHGGAGYLKAKGRLGLHGLNAIRDIALYWLGAHGAGEETCMSLFSSPVCPPFRPRAMTSFLENVLKSSWAP